MVLEEIRASYSHTHIFACFILHHITKFLNDNNIFTEEYYFEKQDDILDNKIHKIHRTLTEVIES